MTIAEKIKNKRKALRMTQRQLAMPTGVSREIVRKWEAGDTDSMTVATLTRLAAVLGVSPGQMFDDSPILPDFQAIQFEEHISLSYSSQPLGTEVPSL